MISTVTAKQSVDKSCHSLAKDQSTRERIMASTMSVDEYFDELIDKVREDDANSERLLAEHDKAKVQKAMVRDSLTRAFDELHSGRVHYDARKLFAE